MQCIFLEAGVYKHICQTIKTEKRLKKCGVYKYICQTIKQKRSKNNKYKEIKNTTQNTDHTLPQSKSTNDVKQCQVLLSKRVTFSFN